MNLIHRRKIQQRTNFRKLPFDGDYWLASNTTTPPDTKTARRSRCNGITTSTGALNPAAISDTTVAVIKTQRFLMVQQ